MEENTGKFRVEAEFTVENASKALLESLGNSLKKHIAEEVKKRIREVMFTGIKADLEKVAVNVGLKVE